ncbi:agmatine deiminase family protein [Streptomyces sp. NBC_00378]|uniref:agmatine deiminase family protein n=1 Tax=unclassified Streptomyces TaxID=2593676 RepID=UPI0022504A3C|nr:MULTISPECIES: agmatine deiminase family protein [unclassified Streptomyces]MCX5112570.1 agmatine deiminase family protein [Streptomyces sp. NBC_00378]
MEEAVLRLKELLFPSIADVAVLSVDVNRAGFALLWKRVLSSPSYANYYLCNGAVISAHFGDTTADKAAKATLARLYPDRVIEQLNIDHLGTGGGGIHCVTQQQPVA